MRQYSAEELQRQFDFKPARRLVQFTVSLLAALVWNHLWCLTWIKPLLWGSFALWLLFCVFTALSAYGNTVKGQPPIGAPEAKMLLMLALVLIAVTVGYGLEGLRPDYCYSHADSPPAFRP
jgi:hypothetical protein